MRKNYGAARLGSILLIAEHVRLVLHEIAETRASPAYIDQAPARRVEINLLHDAKLTFSGVPLYDVTPWNIASSALALNRVVDDVCKAVCATA